MQSYGVPVIVAINHFYADTDEEIAAIQNFCETKGVKAVVAKIFAEGGAGDGIMFGPCFEITREEVDKMLEIFENAISKIEAELG